jgi:NADH dehydrogenase FAD-containing subunit
MSVPGLHGAWAIGDCAAVPNDRENGAPCPPTAQFALRQGPQLAANIARREWNWAMFFPPDIAHLRFTRTIDETVNDDAD